MDKLCQCKKDFIRRCLDFMPRAGITPSVIRVTELSIIECLEGQCTCQEKEEVKEYCSTCGEIHGKKCPEYYLVSKEEPKPECDHVIKISAGGSEFCDLSRIHISGKETDCDESGYQGTVVYYPVCCPECGEKLNLKKDD